MKAKKIILSIITINRNNAKQLEATMESVLSQKIDKNFAIEYIIIDGNSNDTSVKVIKNFANNHKNKEWIKYWSSEPDTGIYNAMNKGLKHASGNLIGILNSGDTFLPDALNKILRLHIKNPEAINYGAIKGFINNHFEYVRCLNADSLLTTGMIPHEAAFVPKKVYDKFGEYDEQYKICSDYNSFLTFFCNKIPFVFSDTIICNYDLTGISATSSLFHNELVSIQRKFGIFKQPSKKKKFKEIIKKTTSKLVRLLGL